MDFQSKTEVKDTFIASVKKSAVCLKKLSIDLKAHHNSLFALLISAATNVMQSEIAQKAVDMGFDPVKVERAILEKIRKSGQGYSSVESLIHNVLSNSEENDPEVSHGNEGMCRTVFVHFFFPLVLSQFIDFSMSFLYVHCHVIYHVISGETPLEKLEKLQREKLCKICMDNDICIVFIPCGHLATCERCSDSLKKCPICCANIMQKIKTYIS